MPSHGARLPLSRALAALAILAAGQAGEPAADLARRILPAAPAQAQVCVVVGAVDPGLPAALHAAGGGRVLVHALLPPAQVAAARAAAGAEPVQIEALPAELLAARRLPYVDRAADLVVAAPDAAAEAELARVAAPGGAIWRTDAVAARAAPAGEGMDEWTHANRDATGNPVSRDQALTAPEALRWIGDKPRGFAAYACRAGGGRFFTCFDVYVPGTANPQPASNDGSRRIAEIEVSARDARTGRSLWTARYAAGSRVQPVVDGDTLILPGAQRTLLVDAATGAVRREIADAGTVRDAAVVGDLLVLRAQEGIVAYDREGRARRWQAALPMPAAQGFPNANFMVNQRFNLLVAGGGRIYVIAAEGDAKKQVPMLVAVDLADGAIAWRIEAAQHGALAYPQFWHDGRLYLTSSFGYACADAATGAPLWSTRDRLEADAKGNLVWKQSKQSPPTMFGRGRHWSPQCFLATGGLVWIRQEGRRRVKEGVDPPLTAEEQAIPAKGWLGLDPATGEVRRQVAYPATEGWLARCYPDIAIGDRMLSWAMEVFDLGTGAFEQYRSTRGVCGSGFTIAYGSVIVPPTPCLYCFPMLRGANAQGAAPAGIPAIAADARLERGPAFGEMAERQIAWDASAWTQYRGDGDRSGSTAQQAPAAPWRILWQAQPGGRASQTVLSGGPAAVAISADIAAGVLTALDPATGAVRWRFATGGRIDTAPTLHDGTAFVGSHDGAIYAIDLADGRLAWRFRAAPQERRILAFDRMESAWPVIGTVAIHRGVLYAIAGRQTRLDGGMTLWALDPATGAPRWSRQLTGLSGEQAVQRPLAFFQPTDHMVLNPVVPHGDHISLHDQYSSWWFTAADGAPVGRPEGVQLRWRGFDRGLQASIVAGQEPWFHHRYIDAMEPRPVPPGEEKDYKAAGKPIPHRLQQLDNSNPLTPQQQMWVFPARTGFGVNLRKLPTKKPDHAELWPASYDQPDLTPEQMPWQGVSLPIDPKAMIVAGGTVLIAGGTTFAEDHAETRLLAFGLADGRPQGELSIPGGACFDGLSVSGGGIYLAMRDGRIVCIGGAGP